ncbi:MAG TPA: hypothetical protein VMM76_18330 [Pirellulaceae bacterium]|nr:hypothetical protein [Pirellulaceae bacterium]
MRFMRLKVSNCTAWTLVLIALQSSPLIAQDQFTGRPIPSGKDAKTNGEYREAFYRYYLQIVDHYKKHTEDPADVQAAGIQLLTATAEARCLRSPSNLDLAELDRLAKQTLDAGSKDVFVQQRYARLRAVHEDFATARPILLECETRLAESSYPPIVSLLNSFYLCSLARATHDESLMETHFPVFLERLVPWVKREADVQEHRRFVFDLVFSLTNEFLTLHYKEAILRALADQGDIDGWFMDAFTGVVQINIAWLHRTSQGADAVTPAGWQSFAKHLEIANDRLHRAWEAQPDYPEAATHMISIAMAGHDAESTRTWFDRAVAAEMDCPQAYPALTNAMLPRWGGSHRIISRFGLECLATGRFDTLVPVQLYTQIRQIEEDSANSDRYWRNPKVYAKLREMFEGYRNAPKLSELQDLYFPRNKILTLYAAVALRAEQWEDAIIAIDSVDGQLAEDVLRSARVGTYELAQAFANTGDAGKSVIEAEQLAKLNTEAALEQAIERLRAASQQNSDERAVAYFPARIRMLVELLAFERGEWMEITFDDNLSGWRGVSGVWARESDTAVVGTQVPLADPAYFNSFALRCQREIQPPYVIRATVEELEGNSVAGVGITVGEVSLAGMGDSEGQFCFAHRHGVGVDRGSPDPATTHSHSTVGMNWPEPKYEMDVRVWPESLILLINQEGPFGAGTTTDFRAGRGFGFAGRCLDTKTRVRFSNVKIRKLPYGPVAALASSEEVIAASDQMLEFEPEDWFARWIRGYSHFLLEDYEEAIIDFLALEQILPKHTGLYMCGASYAKLKNYAGAVDKFAAAVQVNPSDYRALREWAVLEMTAEDPAYRDLDRALAHANEASQAYHLSGAVDDAWQYQLTLADAHAARGDYSQALQVASAIDAATDPANDQQVAAKVAEFHQLKRASYKSAIGSLLWEADYRLRLWGLVLAVTLLAVTLVVVGKAARLGRFAGATIGAFGAAISLGIPCIMMVAFRAGEGSAFITLLGGIVGVAAIGGACGGFLSAAKKSRGLGSDA